MSEPKARASELNNVFPWLLHFTIEDERIDNFRSDFYVIKCSDGLVVIDPVRLEDDIVHEVTGTKHVILTSGHHQRVRHGDIGKSSALRSMRLSVQTTDSTRNPIIGMKREQTFLRE